MGTGCDPEGTKSIIKNYILLENGHFRETSSNGAQQKNQCSMAGLKKMTAARLGCLPRSLFLTLVHAETDWHHTHKCRLVSRFKLKQSHKKSQQRVSTNVLKV